MRCVRCGREYKRRKPGNQKTCSVKCREERNKDMAREYQRTHRPYERSHHHISHMTCGFRLDESLSIRDARVFARAVDEFWIARGRETPYADKVQIDSEFWEYAKTYNKD